MAAPKEPPSRLSVEDRERLVVGLAAYGGQTLSVTEQPFEYWARALSAHFAAESERYELIPDIAALEAALDEVSAAALRIDTELKSGEDDFEVEDRIDSFYTCFEATLQGLLAGGRALEPSVRAACAVASRLHGVR